MHLMNSVTTNKPLVTRQQLLSIVKRCIKKEQKNKGEQRRSHVTVEIYHGNSYKCEVQHSGFSTKQFTINTTVTVKNTQVKAEKYNGVYFNIFKVVLYNM